MYHKEILNFVMTRMISPNEGRNSLCNLNCKQRFADWISVPDVAVGFDFTSSFFSFFEMLSALSGTENWKTRSQT